MPQPDMDLIQNGNRLIQEEMSYDVSSLKREHEILISGLNKQRNFSQKQVLYFGMKHRWHIGIVLKLLTARYEI